MGISSDNVLTWSEIRALFDRVNAERKRFSFSTGSPLQKKDNIATAALINDLKTSISGMSSNSFLSSIANVSDVSVSKDDIIKPLPLTRLASIISNIENTHPTYTGFTSFNQAFAPGFQFESFKTVGGTRFNSFAPGNFCNNYGFGGTYFDSYGFGGFCNGYGFGGLVDVYNSFCSNFRSSARAGSGTNTFTGHRDQFCGTFSFNGSRIGSPITTNRVFCAGSAFTNGCTAPFKGTTTFSGFTAGCTAASFDDCAAANMFCNFRSGTAFTFDGTFGSGFIFSGSYGSEFTFDGTFGSGFVFGAFTVGFQFSSFAQRGGQYFSAYAPGGGTYFNSFNVAGFCSSHNGASFFNTL